MLANSRFPLVGSSSSVSFSDGSRRYAPYHAVFAPAPARKASSITICHLEGIMTCNLLFALSTHLKRHRAIHSTRILLVLQVFGTPVRELAMSGGEKEHIHSK
jgi:hypothetical protein